MEALQLYTQHGLGPSSAPHVPEDLRGPTPAHSPLVQSVGGASPSMGVLPCMADLRIEIHLRLVCWTGQGCKIREGQRKDACFLLGPPAAAAVAA